MRKLTIVLAAVLAVVACKGKKDADTEYAKDLLKKGEAVPELAMMDRDSTLRSLEELRGQWVVLDFWATWCPDCRADVPAMKELYTRFGEKVAFLGVSFDTDPEKLDAYVRENGIAWPQVSDFVSKKESTVGESFHVKWIPSMYLVDPEGKVALGTVMVDKLGVALEAL